MLLPTVECTARISGNPAGPETWIDAPVSRSAARSHPECGRAARSQHAYEHGLGRLQPTSQNLRDVFDKLPAGERSMLNFIQALCRDITGTRCNVPRMSSWRLVDPAQTSVGVDLADVLTLGAGAVLPANVRVYGSHFLVGLESDRMAMSSQMKGWGVGAGVGAGWGLPFAGGKATGAISPGLKRAVVNALGSAGQGAAIDWLKSQVFDGVSGGTPIVAGPDAPAAVTTADFHDSLATVLSLGANFIFNGVSAGLVIVSKNKPVLQYDDLPHARAFGLIAGAGLATSLDVEASGMVYRVGFL